jgi:hypothetical protein
VSLFDKVLGTVRSTMLMNEQLNGVRAELKDLAGDVATLSRSHAQLAQRVARLEGFIEGAVAATGREPRLPKE